MKSMAFLLAASLLATAGCRQAEEEAQTADPAGDRSAARSSSIVAITITDSPALSMTVTVGRSSPTRAVGYKELLSTLADAVAAAKDEKVWVTLKADAMTKYQNLAPALQACLESEIERVMLDGHVAALSRRGLPAALEAQIRVYLQAPGTSYGSGFASDWVDLETPADECRRALPQAFAEIRRLYRDVRWPVLLSPYPGCTYRWILAAYEEIERAGFVNIRLVVSDTPPPPLQPPPKPMVGRSKVKPGPMAPLPKQFPDELFPEIPDTITVLPALVRPPEWPAADRAFFRLDADEAAKAGKIVYLVDRSGSMTDSIEIVKSELKRAIGDLAGGKQFHVIFYSSGPPVESAPKQLVAATEPNKAQAYKFIDNVVAQGETDPSEAIRRAFECKPDLIFLLTDGEFDRSIITLCKDLNKDRKVPIHTVGFLYQSGEPVLKEIAADSGGRYKFVSDADLVSP
jgi:biopolymer transport protein ExbD